MTITRETLELAAKAAGLVVEARPDGKLLVPYENDPDGVTGYYWNPLHDHGQLLDLAMACGIDLMPSVGGIRYWTKRQPTEVIWVKVNCQDFPALAEAVIRAAADQQMAKEGK